MAYIVLGLILILIDQFSKYYISNHYVLYQSYDLIDKVLYLTYIKNKGAAFGILQNYQILFIITTIVILTFITYYYLITANNKIMLKIALILIIAGGVGNLIDRIRLNYVIDFIDVKIWPIFNFADSYVVIGCILLIIFEIFINKDKDGVKGNG